MSFHLVKRNSSYYFRIRIPSDLIDHFQRTEVRKSLKTADLSAAKILCSHWEGKFQQSFALLRSGARYPLEELFPAEKKSQNLSTLIDQYVQDRSPHWTERTKIEFVQYLSVLLNLIGDKPPASISRADCLACRDLLRKLPPNFTKKKKYKGMSVKAIAESNDETVHLSAKTVNKFLTLLSSFFKWCIKQDLLSQNPSEELLLSVKTLASEERDAYSVDDISLIQKKLPRSSSEPEKYWIPMIAMYSGLRLDEICQLQKEDVQTIDGAYCVNINSSGDKHLKTVSASRIVPVHPNLIELGFLRYVDGIKGGQLWKNLEPDQYGRWGHKFGKWYGLFNRKEITDNPKKCFHSFRHTVANQLKQKGVKDSLIAEILGHKNESITTGRYGKNYEVGTLLQALSLVGCQSALKNDPPSASNFDPPQRVSFGRFSWS
ncbi:Site-specific recombinase XerD [Malonomonas rubra DSM 5091]|uniref:Site-specific recombinase XerD n=1 Tax=Malonomonas rubra DSM 5091 TaxID=1122189 RepID=A0A1M6B953_MALRU|nr:DUF6538 domain-containing protein [Malonomonas rubra]SHI45226.1 Site-specific recombinase XerD [Malonomonas rubra DSM 5091]